MNATDWTGAKVAAPGIYRGLPIETYHGDCCDGPSVSSSGLRTIWAESPAAYWVGSPFNPARIEKESRAYFDLGQAAHLLLLGEGEFDKRFVVRPADFPDYRTKAAREWRDAQIAAGRAVLTQDQVETIRGMAGALPWQQASSGWSVPESGLANSEIARALLDGEVEHSIIHRDGPTGVWVKTRPDAIPRADRVIADLKTTAAPIAEKAIWDHHYPMQGALVADALRAVTGETGHTFVLIFVSTSAPYTVTVREINQDDLAIASRMNRAALDTFARCMERREWPASDGDPRPAKMPGWYEARLNAANDRGELPVMEAAE